MTELFWFRNELRLEDNPALAAHAAAKHLICVYFWPRQPAWCNLNGMGTQRERFLAETLRDLQSQLRERGQDLLVLRDAPERALPDLVRRFRVTRLGVVASPGSYERRQTNHLRRQLDIPVELHPGNTLFTADQLPFTPDQPPIQFSDFRRATQRLSVAAPEPCAELPPPPPGVKFAALEPPSIKPHSAHIVHGGSGTGARQLHNWLFREEAARTYKHTRNALQGLYFASGLSPWLANGSLSVRGVAHELARFERQVIRNDSTMHFFQELLWREFFHWRAVADRDRLFRPGGIRGKCQLCTMDPRALARWYAGDTDYPLVNALMHQLVATGWMSNRGRQIAASCLVNELGQDWRYGAAFFEKHLIDYDVASNYGNWQYIAGVGTDPRGGRHFNLAKQAAQYDPDEEFVNCWQGYSPPQPRYVVDASDWPI